ncbi:hypothetical protein AMATHDRAFT_4649 [Amanita thiersii Skay4041]|uniref:FAD-binding PCMH-type domain-containing protein n=1 Tax=Amanita thiersii Skay4041 TaxID=703135 RepID=A0A2A9NPN8_9AGAR|nr:hypothetical protein AMATHDRAFT_4649 [Amanita thiersii Skay4041]
MIFNFLRTSYLLLTVQSVKGGLVSRQDTKTAAQAVCQTLQAKLGKTVVQFTGSAEWDTALGAPWNLVNDDVPPSCIVFPYDHTHVAASMKEIFANDVRYAVQAGGHSAMKYWNVVPDGVLITFTHMKNATYKADTDTISLEPGLQWEEAVLAVEAEGVAPVGSRVRDVGTGLILGGGLSFLSPEYGWASDNFKELDVVLPNGDFVTANADNEYADLFWALKACASRCGVVTRYEVYAVHTGTKEDKNYYGGAIRYPGTASPDLLKFIASYNEQRDPKATFLSLFHYDTNLDGTVNEYTDVYAFYRGTELPDSIFGDLLAMPSLTRNIGPRSYYEVATTIPKYAKGNTHFFGGGAIDRDFTSLEDSWTHWQNFSKAVYKNLEHTYVAYTPVLTPWLEAGKKHGGNPMDPAREFFVINFVASLPDGQTVAPDEVEDARQLWFKQVPPPAGLPLYIGEIDIKQNAYVTYGQYEKLKSIQNKYDPTRFISEHMDGAIGF